MTSLNRTYTIWMFGTCLSVVLLWGLISFVWFDGTPEGFASTEALFSGLAFASLIVTLVMQREELELQREELKSTREELAGQKQQMAIQNQMLTRQRFENTFFQLIRLQNDFIEMINLTGLVTQFSHLPPTGRNAFAHARRQMQAVWHDIGQQYRAPHQLQGISQAYFRGFRAPLWSSFQHYFGNLHSILFFIETSHIDQEERRFYANLLRSTLSGDELVLIFYHGLMDAEPQFKEMIDKYRLTLNVNRDHLLDKGNIEFYPSTFMPT